jgi:hypothetical protein
MKTTHLLVLAIVLAAAHLHAAAQPSREGFLKTPDGVQL